MVIHGKASVDLVSDEAWAARGKEGGNPTAAMIREMLDKGVRVVMVNGFVNGIDGFSDSPKVLNGASEFLLQVFGDAGKHARAAVSVNGLPLGVSVEVQMVLEVRD